MKNQPLARVEHAHTAIKNVAIAGIFAITSLSAWADSKAPVVPPSPKYLAECAACHIAYPAGMLPAPSWQRIMGGLGKHYGTDASLDAASVKQLSDWLQTNAGTYKRVSEVPPEDRITRSAWFVRKHRELAPSVWGLPSVKSAANCAACHSGADKGFFDDDNLIVPAGLDARMRRAFRD